MKNNIFKKVLVMGAMAVAPTVVSAQSANVAIVGENSVYQDDMITLNVKVNNINDVKDGVVAVGGDIMYDPNYLTLVDTIATSNPYKFDGNLIKDGNYRIAGVDFTMENGINTDTVVYSIVFKSVKAGNTTISFENAELVNTDAECIEGSTTSKVLEILEKEVENKEVTTTTIAVEKTTDNKEEVKEVKTAKKETKTVETTKDETKVENKETEENKESAENKGIFNNIISSIADALKKILDVLFK